MNAILIKIRETAPLFGAIGTAGGFIADVLQPIFPFISYIFFASAFASVALVIAIIVKASIQSTATTALVFSFFVMLASGGLYLLQDETTEKNGVLASAIPGIENLQRSMGMIQEDLSAIKESTHRIEETTTRTEKKLDAVAEHLDTTLNELLKSGGVIKNPQKPQDFYANARIYELQGDFANAQRSYVKFIHFDLDYLDPYIRYQKLLKVQNGLEGGREIYLELTQALKSMSAQFSRGLMFSRAVRVKKSTAFITQYPDFGPAYLMLSRDYSEARLGEQTANDKLNERKYLKAFIAQSDQGNVIKYFMDKEMLSTWLEGAKSNIAKLGLLSDEALKNPLSLHMMPTNTSWMIQVISIDKVTELFYKWDDATTDFESTGFVGVIDTSTGNPMPNFTIQAPLALHKQMIHFKYKGLRGEMHGPFSILVDPNSAMKKSAKSVLEATPRNWVSYRKYDGKEMFYFTHLQSSACGIEKALYAYDREANLDQHFPIQACHKESPSKLSESGATWVYPPEGTKYIAVQIHYADGTTSKVQKFMVTN